MKQYLETLDAIEKICGYINGRESRESTDTARAFWNVEWYLDHEQEFKEDERQMIEKGLARMTATYIMAQLKKGK
jgi:hypothetical protein